MGILIWMNFNLSDLTYFTRSYNTRSVPIYFLLMKEIAYNHMFQRERVLEVVSAVCTMDTQLRPLASVALKKSCVDVMFFLMECDCVIPVLETVVKWAARKFDRSLIRYFVLKVRRALFPYLVGYFLTQFYCCAPQPIFFDL